MKINIFIFLGLLLSACITSPTPVPTVTASAPFVLKSADNPYAPKAEDANLKIGGVELTSINLSEQVENTPVRV